VLRVAGGGRPGSVHRCLLRLTELAYVGLGLHLGTPVSQSAAGDLLGHVHDTGVVRDETAGGPAGPLADGD
jgi:hypothetical protein